MKQTAQSLKNRYSEFFSDRRKIMSVVDAFTFLLGSLIVNYFASQYAFVNKGNSVTDIILDNLPVVRMDAGFVVGTLVFLILVTLLVVSHPKKITFVVKSIALFVLVRSLFVTLTHIGPSPLNTLSAPGEIGRAFSSGADLFFSGHTGMPYLFALIYWYNKSLRYIFMICSIIAAAAVLLGHIHYSIDVASAYFITYGIYIIARQLFKKDFEQFRQ